MWVFQVESHANQDTMQTAICQLVATLGRFARSRRLGYNQKRKSRLAIDGYVYCSARMVSSFERPETGLGAYLERVHSK